MPKLNNRWLPMVVLAVAIIPQLALGAEDQYDPLKIPKGSFAKPLDLVVKDDARSREIPVRIYVPAGKVCRAGSVFQPRTGRHA